MFAQNLNSLLMQLGATGAEIAKYAGFDRTNISRFRSGARVPSPNGDTIKKLVSGVVLFAQVHGRLGLLCDIIRQDPGTSPEEICDKLSEWLFEGETDSEAGSRAGRRNADFRPFSERLDIAMVLAGLSNVQLSQLINVDASLISRYRSGTRTPQANPELAGRLSGILWTRIQRNGQVSALAEHMQCPEEDPDSSCFQNWLYHSDPPESRHITTAERILKSLSEVEARTGYRLPACEDALPESCLQDKREIYFGKTGLQEAVLRFLGSAIAEKAEELWLYSDQNMDWMTEESFIGKWNCLMHSCAANGIHIRIIHNIDRDSEEIDQAIRSWLPLYLTGRVEAWYCRNQNHTRFTHTIFICPGRACIYAFHASEAEENGLYHYYTEPALLEACALSYRKLLEGAKRLTEVAQPTFEEARDGCATAVLSTLSLSTMPPEVAESFGNRALSEAQARRKEAFERHLFSGGVRECVALPDRKQVEDGTVPVERVPGAETLFYSAGQYEKHVRHIQELARMYPAYRFYALREIPFKNVNILISTDSVTVERTEPPLWSIRFSDPQLSRAMLAYTERLIKENPVYTEQEE